MALEGLIIHSGQKLYFFPGDARETGLKGGFSRRLNRLVKTFPFCEITNVFLSFFFFVALC